MSESLRITELRREIAEMEATRDQLDPALYEALHASLISDLEELGATLVTAPEPARRRIPAIVRHSASPRPHAVPSQTQEVRHADSPGKARAIGAPIPEVPMTSPTRGHHHDPPARIAHLVGRIKEAAKKGEKLYWAQQEIRDICAVYQLGIPPEAQKTRPGRQAAPPDRPAAKFGDPHSEMPGGKTTVEIWVRGLKRWQLDAPLSPEHLQATAPALMATMLLMEGSKAPAEEWRQIARDLAILETTAGAARQIAERHAEVA